MIHCPNCAAGLRFDIGYQQMVCDHCDSRFDPAALDYREKDDAKGVGMFDTYVYVCPSCGAELMTTDETDAIGFCPFCGGASMLFDKLRQQWRPDYVIPFQITKDQCKELYVKAAKRSWLTSSKYRKPELIEEFRGIYMPFWEYKGEHKGHYTVSGIKKGFMFERTYRVTGEIDYTVDGYAHDASMAFDDRISENIVPYDIEGQKPFAPGYLSGFYADIGDVDQKKYSDSSADLMAEDTALSIIRQKAVSKGRLQMIPSSTSISTEVKDAKRVLYPVWFMSYRNKNHITYAAVNGQTGKVSADFPVSPLRIMIAVLLLGAVIAGLLFAMPSVKANMTLGFTAVLLALGTYILRKNFNNVVNAETGLDKTPEAIRFKKRETVRYVLVGICAAAGIVVAFMDLAYNIISYGLCFVMAAALFYMMFCHIRFQIDIAKRKPPQFNKKGAEYDE